MFTPEKIAETLMPILILVFVIGVNLIVFYFALRSRRKADEICQELIAQNWDELKLITDCMLMRGRTFNQRGLLVMFIDRIVFLPTGRGERIEIPFSQLSQIATSKSAFWGNLNKYGRKLVLYQNERKLIFYLNPFTYYAWVSAIEKLSPMITSGITRMTPK